MFCNIYIYVACLNPLNFSVCLLIYIYVYSLFHFTQFSECLRLYIYPVIIHIFSDFAYLYIAWLNSLNCDYVCEYIYIYSLYYFLLYIEHAPLLLVVLHDMLQFFYMYSFIIIIVHRLLGTLLHIIKVYWLDKPAKDLLVLDDQVLFACCPRFYVSYNSFRLLSGVITLE